MKTNFNYSGNKNYFIPLFIILFSITSHAQIIYTDLIPDSIVSTNGGIYHLDLNNDGTIDFNLKFTRSSIGSIICQSSKINYGVTVSPVDTLNNAVANSDYSGVNFPAPIFADSVIDDSSFIWVYNTNQNLLNVRWICTGTKSTHAWHTTVTGKWIGAIDKFLGLKFKIAGNTFYGWVRLSINSTSLKVSDYAYNSVADQLIHAGQSSTEFLTTSPIAGSPFCVGDTVKVGYTVYGNFDSTNVFTAQLSDSAGSFANPVNIGSITSNISDSIVARIPPGSIYGLLYRIRVVASSPIGISNYNNSNLIINDNLPLEDISTTDSTVICEGATSRLTVSAQSGNSFQWRMNNSDINNATNYFYYADTVGSYRCNITNGCGSVLSDSINLNLMPAPDATITSSKSLWICPGQSITFSTDTTPGNSYIWHRGTISVGTQSNYTTNQAGIYFVKITNSSGCSSNSLHDTLVIGKPSAYIVAWGPVSFCAGDSVMLALHSVVDTGFLFQWYLSNNFIPGATSPSYYASQTGAYTLKVINPNGNCDSISQPLNVNAVCSGIDPVSSENSHFNLSPNPSNNLLEIRKQTERPVNIQIINQLGQTLFSEKINSSRELIDISKFSEGIFFLKYIEGDITECRKIIITR